MLASEAGEICVVAGKRAGMDDVKYAREVDSRERIGRKEG
jgi:hypothetical protein